MVVSRPLSDRFWEVDLTFLSDETYSPLPGHVRLIFEVTWRDALELRGAILEWPQDVLEPRVGSTAPGVVARGKPALPASGVFVARIGSPRTKNVPVEYRRITPVDVPIGLAGALRERQKRRCGPEREAVRDRGLFSS